MADAKDETEREFVGVGGIGGGWQMLDNTFEKIKYSQPFCRWAPFHNV